MVVAVAVAVAVVEATETGATNRALTGLPRIPAAQADPLRHGRDLRPLPSIHLSQGKGARVVGYDLLTRIRPQSVVAVGTEAMVRAGGVTLGAADH